MDRNASRLPRYVCKSCRSHLTRSPSIQQGIRRVHQQRDLQRISFARVTQRPATNQRSASSPLASLHRSLSTSKLRLDDASNGGKVQVKDELDLGQLEAMVAETLKDDAVPTEEACTTVLKNIEAAAQQLVEVHSLETPADPPPDEASATSAILSLQARSASRPPPRRRTVTEATEETINAISLLAYKFAKHPRVFITTAALEHYTKTQALLSRPDSLPEIFDLFANKPVPTAATSPSASPTFRAPKADALNAAIPPQSASLALNAALHVRNLPLAVELIATSYQRPAFKRAKILRRGLPPLTAAAVAPVAMYTLASNFAAIQTGLDPATFANIAFAGLATYLGAVGTVGYVAITSSNDQMRRVTWAPGMPLSQRWVREEERAAVDRVVCAWGFKDKRRWGEEEGDEWDALKEWAGLAGMIVDRVALMEGME